MKINLKGYYRKQGHLKVFLHCFHRNLGRHLKEFENDPCTKNVHILRSKADCLRICKNGPILLVWPDGIWYEKVSPEKISEIFTSHIINGKPIEKWIFKKTPFLNSPRY